MGEVILRCFLKNYVVRISIIMCVVLGNFLVFITKHNVLETLSVSIFKCKGRKV
jgi:hypothetical protein